MNGIEQNPKLGYYRVGDKTFYSKPEAYIYATQVDIEPSWHFNSTEFAEADWLSNPELSLREIYRLRAQQLRNKYDWIRIEASGGGDSTTAIFSFLLNGIHLDEVVFRYPKQVDKGVTDDPYNTKPENTLSEWQYAAKPLFDWIATNYPGTKITFHDYSDTVLKDGYMKDESWVFTTRDWFQPGHGAKHNNFAVKEHRDLADSGKSIAVVYGIDKPKVVLIDNKWYMYFIDVFANHANPIVEDYTNVTTELFYWTPDLPEIVIKQSHMIKSWFDQPQNQSLKNLVTYPVVNPNLRTSYEGIAKSIIYPDYDQQTWQTSKPTNSFYNEMDHWFHVNLKDTKIYSAWESGLEFIIDKIDPKLLQYQSKKPVGLRWNSSAFYYLGDSSVNYEPRVFTNNPWKSIKTEEITVVHGRKIKRLTV
jgi:hypothetical protein